MSEQHRVVREKETFRTEQIVNIDGVDVKFYVKSSVNYERLSYKVQPVITMSHGDSDEVDEAMKISVRECRNQCKARLAQYREDAGIGTQTDLFASSTPSEGKRSKRSIQSEAEAA